MTMSCSSRSVTPERNCRKSARLRLPSPSGAFAGEAVDVFKDEARMSARNSVMNSRAA